MNISHQNGINAIIDRSVSLYSNPHFVRLLIDALAWPDVSTNDSVPGVPIAGMISRIALLHL